VPRKKDREKSWLEAILHSTADGLIVFDQENHVTHINPAAEKLLGIEKNQALQNHPSIGQLLAQDREKSRDEMPWVDEAYMESSSKTLKILTDPVLDDEGKPLGYMKTLQDVTLEKEVDKMKTEFISTVSHELRTPLTSIKGYVDLILDGEAGEINEIQSEFLEIVKQNNDRLVELINDLLDVSRMESGRVKMEKEPLWLPEVIREAVVSIENLAKNKDMSITLDIPEGLPLVLADRQRLLRILVNLLSNAIKYTQPKGKLFVSVKPQDGFLATSVRDTGIGIPSEHLDRLFVKFYRVDSSLTSEIGGTGLGLAIVKSIVDLHGGQVWAESEVGKGSTFTFTLPLDKRKEETRKAPVRPKVTLAKGDKILVVDDEPDIVRLIEIHLEKEGFRVISALGGPEALRMAEEEEPSLITLDIMMEDMNGFEVLRALKDNPKTAHIPVIMLSIIADEYKCLRVGASSFLTKPIEPRKLIEVVNSLLDRKAKKKNIIVVLEDKSLAEQIGQTVGEKGFDALEVVEMADLLEKAKKRKPNLIILDLDTTSADSVKAIKALKKDKETMNIPIVALTGQGVEEAISRAEKAGANGYLSKGFSPDSLLRSIEDIFEGKPN
jgi:PAS domain S-box-containing protein